MGANLRGRGGPQTSSLSVPKSFSVERVHAISRDQSACPAAILGIGQILFPLLNHSIFNAKR